MASLADLYGKAKATARQIPANLRQSGKGLASWAVDPYGEAQRVMGEYGAMTPEQRQGLVDTAVDLFGGVDVGPVGAIKASHGSPHLFDRFDFSKIGTGEGAQAYGHGGYFAQGFDSPVAKQYQENVKDMDAIKAINNRMAELAKIMESDNAGQYRKFKSDVGRNAASEYDALMQQRSAVKQNPGHLYNVELKWPDAAIEAADPLGEQHLLDWDAPISEQPQAVQDIAKYFNILTTPSGIKEARGSDLYSAVSQRLQQPPFDASSKNPGTVEGSEFFYNKGIPGIRYLDQGSRASGTGSRNYVMFDDRFPNIVTRNGVSLTDLLRNK